MKKGDYVNTPRFCKVKIDEVFASRQDAAMAGYTEPTHYHDGEYSVYGKTLETEMRGGTAWAKFSFAACREE